MVAGDGIYDGEKKMSDKLRGDECVKACLAEKQVDSSISGVTMKKNGGQGSYKIVQRCGKFWISQKW